MERLTSITKPKDLKVHLNLVMTETTLLGLDDKPGQLLGLGPIPPAVGRLIAATGDTWVKRVFTDPVDGTALVTDTRRRRFRGPLRDLIVARDEQCRGPQCLTRIHDIDHLIEHAKGGHTTLGNGQGLSKGCHTMRDRPDVTVARVPESNAISWTLPSGATTTSLPPPVLGYGAGDRREVRARKRLAQRGSLVPAAPGPNRGPLRC